MKPQYYVNCNATNPYVGDHLGQPAATRWRVVGFECQQGGGPYHWFHQYYRSISICYKPCTSLEHFFLFTEFPRVTHALESVKRIRRPLAPLL